MNRYLLTFLILLSANKLIGQKAVTLTVDNSEPRVGQEFVLTIKSDFLDSYLEQILPDEIEIKPGGTELLTEDTYKTLMATKEGPITIGPMEFTFNGEKYKSNVLKINIIPSLSDEEGLWVRKVTIDETEYVLLEQILTAKKIKSKNGNTTTTKWEDVDDQFAELIVDTDFEGVEFQDSHSGKGGHPDKTMPHPNEVRYSYQYYRIKKSPGFKGELRLNKDHFVRLPKNIELTDVVIK